MSSFGAWLTVSMTWGTVIAALAALTVRCLKRHRATARHYVWLSAIATIATVTLVSPWLPTIELRILSAPPVLSDNAAFPPVANADPLVRLEPAAVPPQPSRVNLVALFWLCGAIVTAAILLRRFAYAAWLVSRSSPFPLPASVTSPVPVKVHPHAVVPMLCQVINPCVVLPASAHDWSEDRVKIILAHETAHFRRRDHWWVLLTSAVCWIQWPNPFVWYAARQMAIEREYACDEAVIATGVRPSAYATELVSLASHIPASRSAWQLSMASCPALDARVRAVIRPSQFPSGGSPMRVLTTWSLVCVLFIVFPTMRLVAKPAAAIDSQQGDPRAAADLKSVDSDFARGLARALQEGRFDLRPTADDGVAPHLTDAAVGVLFSSTRHAAPEVRRLAAWALGEARVMTATAPLLGLLRDDPDAGVRAQAAQSLGDIAAPDAVAGLGEALTDDTDDVRQRAARALGDVGVPAIVEVLEPALTANSNSIRDAAEWAVRQAAERAPDATLLDWLRHRHPEVRLHAAHVLGDRRLVAASDALRSRLGDEDTRVQQKAAWALREIRNR